MLRGYLNSSRQRYCFDLAGGGGQRDLSRIDLQRPGERAARFLAAVPCAISQCGDSGTQARINSVSAAGSSPTANRPRQPIIRCAETRPSNAPSSMPAGSSVVVRPVTQPRLYGGHEFLYQR